MIYFILILLTFWGYIQFDQKKKSESSKRVFYILEFIVLVLVVALRYRVGGDSIGYEDEYETLNGMEELLNYNYTTSSAGLLWYAFVAFCQSISSEWLFFQIMHALVVNVAVFRFVKKHCSKPFLAIALYTIFNYLYFNTEILRASLAVAVFLLWGYDALLEKKWVKFFILAFVSANFHIEGVVIFFFPLAYVLGKFKINELGLIAILLGAVLLLNVFKLDSFLFSLAQYSEAIEHRASLYSEIEEYNTNWLIAKVIVLVPVFLCLWGTKYLEKDPHTLSLIRGLLIFYTIISVFTIYFPAFFSRLIDAIRILYVVSFADILGTMKRKRMNALYIAVLVVALFCGGFMQYREHVINIKYYPYHSVLFPEKVPEREYLFMERF